MLRRLVSLFGLNRARHPPAASGTQPPPPRRPLSAPPQITSESEDNGFVDLTLFITQHAVLPDGSRSIHAAGLHNRQPVAFQLVLASTWKPSTHDVGLTFFSGTALCRSLGAASDAFLAALAELYAVDQTPSTMAPEVQLAAVALAGDPTSPDHGPVKIKMFFEPQQTAATTQTEPEDEEDGGYAEFYINIDLALRRLEFLEKDGCYRRALVKAFSAR